MHLKFCVRPSVSAQSTRLQNFVAEARLAFHLPMRESADMQTVSVLIPLALPGPYDYAVPEGLGLARGDFVRVPLGPDR